MQSLEEWRTDHCGSRFSCWELGKSEELGLHRSLRGSDIDVKRLLQDIQLSCRVNVEHPGRLIILDEIQEYAAALTMLKYFCEDAWEYHIIAAGSLLGIESFSGVGISVSKIDRLMLYPLTFTEFPTATGNQRFVELLRSHDWETVRVCVRFAGMTQEQRRA